MKQSLFAVFSIIICSFLLSACAAPQTMRPHGTNAEIMAEQIKQSEVALKRLVNDSRHVQKIGHPILAKNTNFCGEDVAIDYGFSIWNIYDVGVNYKIAADNIYSLGENLQVFQVIPNSPAAKAGLKRGDKVKSVNGTPFPYGKGASKKYHKIIRNKKENKKASIVINRQGIEKTVNLTGKEICHYPLMVTESDVVNAYADGDYIYITRGMLRFIDTDQELALVIAHELGHNAMGHIKKMKQNAVTGAIAGAILDAALGTSGFSNMGSDIGRMSHSIGFEQEADYAGMYFLKRAGYSTNGAANFWRRMAANNSSSINRRSSSHPSSPERFVDINKTHDEIMAKVKAGKALEPELKPKTEFVKTNKNRGALND